METEKFFNRELSWIEFNARVLHEARRKDIPLLERLQYLSIVSSNFNEFFQVRVAAIKRLEMSTPKMQDSSGYTPKSLLRNISLRVHEIMNEQQNCLKNEILPELEKEGFVYRRPEDFSATEDEYARNCFQQEILPLLTPLRTDLSKFPQIGNMNYHAAFMLKPIKGLKNSGITSIMEFLKAASGMQSVALVQIPSGINRIVWLPSEGKKIFSLADDLLIKYGTLLFPGYEVTQSMLFNVARDADFAVDEDFATSENHNLKFIKAMEKVLVQRKSSFAVRVICDKAGPDLKQFIMTKLNLTQDDFYEFDRLTDPVALMELKKAEGIQKLCFEPWQNFYPPQLPQDKPLWDTIKHHDILLHVPYESYQPVIKFLEDAAEDKDVISIKMTLYRTGRNSPVISALEKAARNGKQVTVLIEVKARFDENTNIAWADELEKAGVTVVYGLVNLKVHAKAMMIIRREENALRRYVHLSTGNYNPSTAKLYSDFSLFTANQDIANDITKFFNLITGYSLLQTMKCLSMAPDNLKSNLQSMINREIELSTPESPGLIIAKMNNLTHEDVIRMLYKASNAGVKVLLNVRGICMLVPGEKGMSENIKVISIVDRYLEHERIFYFQNGGSPELYLASSDWMPRNLERRVELMFPVQDPEAFKEIKEVLDIYFSSTGNVFTLKNTGKWEAAESGNAERKRAQEILYNRYRERNDIFMKQAGIEYKVRRKD